MTLLAVDEIARRLNAQAESLAPELLPNGERSGLYWMASGIADTGLSTSLYVHLAGDKIGQWRDAGNAAPGEEFGDMLDLLRLKRGYSTAEAVAEAKRRLGIVDEPRRAQPLTAAEHAERAAERRAAAEASAKALAERQQREAATAAQKIKRAKGLFFSGAPIAGTPADWYLRGRCLEPAGSPPTWPGSLRYHPDVWCADERVKVPTMLAACYLPDGSQTATHRTFLQFKERGGWCKLDTPRPKKLLGAVAGAFVPINKGSSGTSMRAMPEGEAVYMTEGIEDALTVRMVRPNFRIICGLNLDNMGAIVLPPAARKLVICGDRDDSEGNQTKLERVIGRHQARGVDVFLAFPEAPYKDFNEWFQALHREARRKKRH